MKKVKIGLIVIGLIVLCGIIFFIFKSRQTQFNDDYASGNTAGNLNNGGLFCEYDDKVYFSNPYDEGKLYVMNSDGSDIKMLSEDTVQSINVYGKYIYYTIKDTTQKSTNDSVLGFINTGKNCLCRININGKNRKYLDSDPSMNASLVGNYIYYIHYDTENASTLYRVKIDGKEKAEVSKNPLNCNSVYNGKIYSNNIVNNGDPIILSPETNNTITIYDGDSYNCVTQDGSYLYFMDCENDYRLVRVDLSTAKKETIVDERIETFNLYGDVIYYLTNNEPALYKIDSDGNNSQKIMDGAFSDINITSQYVYFHDFGVDAPIYMTPLNGTGVSIFDPLYSDQ